MPNLKFLKISWLFLPLLCQAYNPGSCLKKDFSITVNNQGLLWGALPIKLTLEKVQCGITIKSDRYFGETFREEWQVDVCREPIHIKNWSVFGQDVFKYQGNCLGEDPFCGEVKDLIKLIQDDGLIFAKGKKQNLQDDHGMVDCAYQLLKIYLQDYKIINPDKFVSFDQLEPPKPKVKSYSGQSLMPGASDDPESNEEMF